MFHPFAAVGGVLPEPLDSYKGPIGCSIFSHEFYETDERRGFVRGFQLQIVRAVRPAQHGARRLRGAAGALGRRRTTPRSPSASATSSTSA